MLVKGVPARGTAQFSVSQVDLAILRADLLHPPPSSTKPVGAWIVTHGPREGLAVKQDAVGNIIIKKPATGMENRKAVVLCPHRHGAPGNADTQHDFTTDPIDAYRW